MFKAVIFDLDGTLCYTIDDLRTAMNAMLEEKGYPVRTKEEIYAAINFGSREFVRRSLPEELRSDEDEVTDCHRLYPPIPTPEFPRCSKSSAPRD